VDWGRFEAAVLRSPWNYVDALPAFLAWCDRVAQRTRLFNPPRVSRWSLDKRYLGDLAAAGVPVVPTEFVAPQVGDAASLAVLDAFMARHPASGEVVIKPTVGAYSKDVRRFPRAAQAQAHHYLRSLQSRGAHVMLQPYLAAIDRDGETNLAFFDGHYSHAIRKGAMLMSDGTVHVPTQDLRQARQADAQEQAVARLALQAAARHLQLDQPLLYARVDLIRDGSGQPRVLELELCEPSLNLPFADGSALRFAQAIARRLGA
jgi:O-ureido-D-serine cyclo-ligase